MVDLLLRNANVLTMDAQRPRAVAVAVVGSRVVAVYDDPVEAAHVAAARVVDLDGATLTPGFNDAHNHMAWYGLGLLEVDLGTPPVHDLTDLYDAVAARAETLPADAWVVGSGYDQNKIGGHPDRAALDRAGGGRKVWLKHTSGHMCCVSSAVLVELGLSEHQVEVEGGAVVVDGDRRPTGLLQERAQSLVSDLVLPYPLDELEGAIERAGRQYLREGITSVTEAGIAGGWIGKSPVELAAYQDAYAHGRLPVRVQLMVAHDALHPVAAHADDGVTLGLDLGMRSGFGDDWLRVGPMKIFTDGSLIGRTAAMGDDFADAPGNRGYLQADAETLTRAIVDAHVSGWRIAAHAIGDAAIDLVLDAYEECLARRPDPDPRFRIEHFAVARHDQVARAARLGVVAVPQGRFVSELGDAMAAALGPERVGWTYRQRSLLDAGLVLPGSSDRPVVQGAPLAGMHDLVHRRTAGGAEFGPAETVTAEEALHAYTVGSAYASRSERDLGTVSAGRLADFAVLAEDPTTVDPDRIADVEVLATWVDGTCRYDRGAPS